MWRPCAWHRGRRLAFLFSWPPPLRFAAALTVILLPLSLFSVSTVPRIQPFMMIFFVNNVCGARLLDSCPALPYYAPLDPLKNVLGSATVLLSTSKID